MEGEERALDVATMVFTSTQQEVRAPDMASSLHYLVAAHSITRGRLHLRSGRCLAVALCLRCLCGILQNL